jgi:hypothetical protein
MKEILCYQCEICGEVHTNKNEALKCEGIGKQEPLAKVGDLINYNYNVSGFECVGTIKVSKIIQEGHFIKYKIKSQDYEGRWINGFYGTEYIWGNNEFIRRTTQ